MFLMSKVTLIFIISLVFVAAIILIWVVTSIIVKNNSKKKQEKIAAEDAKKAEDTSMRDKIYAAMEAKAAENGEVTSEESKEPQNEEVESTEAVDENGEVTSEESTEETTPVIIAEDSEEKSDDKPAEEAIDSNEQGEEFTEVIKEEEETSKENDETSGDQPAEDIVEKAEDSEEDSKTVEESVDEPTNDDIEEENTESAEDEVDEPTNDQPVEAEKDEVTAPVIPVEENDEAEEENKKPKKNIKAVPVKKGRTYNGKYEIFEIADGYAYHLKASNGEILVASETYSSRDSVLKAIKAVQKNLETGEVRIFADKKGKYKFKLIAKNYKTLAISASYSAEKSAVRASESFKKYALIADIVDVELDDQEAKSATPIEITVTEDKDGGKFVIEKFDGEYSWDLKASNGQILCQAEGYTSKNGCLYSIETFKKNIVEGQFKCIKDKNGHYCYKLYTANNRVCAIGESYTSKQSAESAANSVVSYYKNATIDEIK